MTKDQDLRLCEKLATGQYRLQPQYSEVYCRTTGARQHCLAVIVLSRDDYDTTVSPLVIISQPLLQ